MSSRVASAMLLNSPLRISSVLSEHAQKINMQPTSASTNVVNAIFFIGSVSFFVFFTYKTRRLQKSYDFQKKLSDEHDSLCGVVVKNQLPDFGDFDKSVLDVFDAYNG